MFWNQAEAALEKSRLDDYGIFCALIHENAHLYGGAPLAMQIRLLVSQEEANRAHCILSGDLEAAAKIEAESEAAFLASDLSAEPERRTDKPWELVVLAFYLLLPGVAVLQTKYPALMQSDRRASRAIAAVAIIHFFGWLGIALALALVIAYVYVRHSGDSSPRSRSF
jgi:hypothetical protein